MTEKALLKAHETTGDEFDWGKLWWFASGKLGNSEAMTTGQCLIKPGQENPRHYHPNCEEILHLISGRIVHSLGDEEFEMWPGDTITILPNVVHNARNAGTDDAIMTISFSSAYRQFVKV
ncbi:MAG: cupin domain-containing protein [Anaerolineae bacterium]|nr:cupin domain-containing protein [Anaerolineae bacterium]